MAKDEDRPLIEGLQQIAKAQGSSLTKKEAKKELERWRENRQREKRSRPVPMPGSPEHEAERKAEMSPVDSELLNWAEREFGGNDMAITQAQPERGLRTGSLSAGKAGRGLTTGSLQTPAQGARGELMDLAARKGFNVDPLQPGGFANRDLINQQVRSSSQDEKRLRRAANLAYRDAVRRGDRKGALDLLLNLRDKGVSFGGIRPAGEAEANVIQQRGEDFITAVQRQQKSGQDGEAQEEDFVGSAYNRALAVDLFRDKVPRAGEGAVEEEGPPVQAQGDFPVSQPSRASAFAEVANLGPTPFEQRLLDREKVQEKAPALKPSPAAKKETKKLPSEEERLDALMEEIRAEDTSLTSGLVRSRPFTLKEAAPPSREEKLRQLAGGDSAKLARLRTLETIKEGKKNFTEFMMAALKAAGKDAKDALKKDSEALSKEVGKAFSLPVKDVKAVVGGLLKSSFNPLEAARRVTVAPEFEVLFGK